MNAGAPKETLEVLADWGTELLETVIAIDSQSDESSHTIPSTEGQRRLSDRLRTFFDGLGYASEQDDSANLLVRIPAKVEGAPPLALMVHMDTARGTRAVPSLCRVPQWKGERIVYPANDRLHVDIEAYPYLRHFLGDDLLHGPGGYPVGFDDKLGMAELMTLARILAANPELPHGELYLAFRPDEEIGRMEAVEGLAATLERKGVRYGYTVDGIVPFEINVENFYAARGSVRIAGRRLTPPGRRTVTLRVLGVNTHGATARAEGYLNATVVFARAMGALESRRDLAPIDFATDDLLEANAKISFAVASDEAERAILDAFEAQIGPARRRGAHVEMAERGEIAGAVSDAAVRLARHLRAFLFSQGVHPLLAEESEGFEGYSNPHRVWRNEDVLVVDYRLRDFDEAGLARREEHLRQVAATHGLPVETSRQYVNMGPALASHPELVRWAEQALRAIGREPQKLPIRGGTGVDPFLARGIPVANLGTGYFAPESEKEITSRQNIARHALWLARLVQEVAGAR